MFAHDAQAQAGSAFIMAFWSAAAQPWHALEPLRNLFTQQSRRCCDRRRRLGAIFNGDKENSPWQNLNAGKGDRQALPCWPLVARRFFIILKV